ncbi:hypothetical protein LUZ61_016546 [Rhynchospora tenuis]|uniref:Uncharacterized protein n=1 Tax=Rhynchospora tenuis TaxID=198213 RepID=A0AAD5Z5P9_9POAL|nr:hypothetical protein LUZ61_016546 [Rhynchospora tenuis]
MEIEQVKCDCCGLGEDCTQDYIANVRANFNGMWLCGLCSEAVQDEITKAKKKGQGAEAAVGAHMSFCRKIKVNPAMRVADEMRQMLRRRSGDLSRPALHISSSPKRFGRSSSSSQVGDKSSLSLY